MKDELIRNSFLSIGVAHPYWSYQLWNWCISTTKVIKFAKPKDAVELSITQNAPNWSLTVILSNIMVIKVVDHNWEKKPKFQSDRTSLKMTPKCYYCHSFWQNIIFFCKWFKFSCCTQVMNTCILKWTCSSVQNCWLPHDENR